MCHFAVYEQCDAAECLKMILHQISPQASELLRGQLRDTTKCSKGHIINAQTNPFRTLPLSLKDTPDTTCSVEKVIQRTFWTKALIGNNKLHCNKCQQKTKATTECELVDSPQILILHLKRFDFDYNTRSHFKSHRCVEVPCELQLKNKTYKLYGMVNHMGSIRGGHYTATVLSEDNTWYECDDAYVSKVEEQPFATSRTFSSKTVYLLMYKALQGCHYSRYDQGGANDLNLLSLNDNHGTTYSEESSLKKAANTKSCSGDHKVSCDEKIKTTSSSAKKMITEHKVELINCLSADHSYILQHAHAKQIITDRQYQNIKEKSPSTPQETVTDLIDHVILKTGPESWTAFLEVLKLPDVLSTYPRLKEIINEMLRSNSGCNVWHLKQGDHM
ncbi:putative ubiquitin carboxyl-terminal hydrolase 50 [Sparus aurata]|uniref:putative ubiquitin carboxyl-terminal hydrolase 50 n=1 Tax=Sparus aurata TaxID=8175 RepID=UPI0011C10D15|nr:putative ubiquitin carboxyl-terminal hydrolase 50 [Sparus aurata]XP_030287811.1 putative ubiquitin carboxyl-terminal hydrolase 50 [Sparus aurata]